ncbi:hypothetical protein ACFX19_031764 [Malus domestica]
MFKFLQPLGSNFCGFCEMGVEFLMFLEKWVGISTVGLVWLHALLDFSWVALNLFVFQLSYDLVLLGDVLFVHICSRLVAQRYEIR